MKILTHSRDKVGDFQSRALLHIPIGFLIGIASLFPFMSLGSNLTEIFTKYERNEDVHTEDEAWKDLFGAMLGMSIAILLVIAAGVYILLRLFG